jgi:adenosylcobinamide kinase/adenosylcobinamide-phosphate guanylyltransferase
MYEQIEDPDNFDGKTIDVVEQLAFADIDVLCAYAGKHGKRLIFVTNEVGMGIIPFTKYSRYFRDSLGRINKYIAEVSDRAVLMVAGLPVVLK